LTLRIFG